MISNKFFHKIIIIFLIINSSIEVYARETKKFTGEASYYADKFSGKSTASGELYNPNLHTAAHRTLPFHTLLKVTNKKNNLSVIVRVNDRGPHVKKRIIDLSKIAAEKIQLLEDGLANVELTLIGPGFAGTEPTQNQNTPTKLESTDLSTPEKEKTPFKSDSEKIIFNTEKFGYRNRNADSTKKFFVDMSGFEVSPKGYGFQIGAFSLQENAYNLGKKANKLGISPIIIEFVKVKDDYFHRVIIGDYNNLEDAYSSSEIIVQKGFSNIFLYNYNE
jgi:rare lipoprotein A